MAGVSYTYGVQGGGIEALRDVSFSVGPGELVAVLGRNGSGKSTLGLLCNGLLLPSEGDVLVDGVSTSRADTIWEIRATVGVVFQNPDNQIVGTQVEEDVAFGPENLGVERAEMRTRVDRALADVGLDGEAAREPHLLSGGQKQRLAIAGVLALDPAYLVLDEPTALLDPAGRAAILEIIDRLRARGHGIVHITHHLADAARATCVLVLDGGTVVFKGSFETLLASADRFEEWGVSVPPMMRLAAELRHGGLSVPLEAVEPARIVEALWP